MPDASPASLTAPSWLRSASKPPTSRAEGGLLADLGAGGGEDSVQVLDKAVEAAGYKGMAANLTRDSLLRNLDIADRLGCLTATGLAEMKRGRAATVVRGPYAGD